MSAILHFFGRTHAECADDEPTLWLLNLDSHVSVELTPRNIEELEAACAEARKYHAMAVIQQAARDEAERLGEPT